MCGEHSEELLTALWSLFNADQRHHAVFGNRVTAAYAALFPDYQNRIA